MLKRLIIFVMLLCFAVAGTSLAATSRMLDKNTELHPQGWSVGETIKFKKNTAVRLNDNGEVISGTLAEDTELRPAFWQQNMADNTNAGFVEFKKETCVYFDEAGNVTAGTLKKAAPWKTGGAVTTLEEKTEYKFTESGAEKTPSNPQE